MTEMAAPFVAQCPRMLSAIRKAIACQPKMPERAPHTLRGSVGKVAAPAAIGAALTLEMAASREDFEQARCAGGILEQALEHLTSALTRLGKEVAR